MKDSFIGFGFAAGSGSRNWTAPLTTEYTDFIARVTTSSDNLKRAYRNVIYRLVAKGYFARMDAFHLYATENEQAALLNIIKDAHNQSNVGAMAFTVGVGYKGATNKYLNSNFNPSTDGVNFTQNSNSVGIYHETQSGVGNVYAFGSFFTRFIGLVPRKNLNILAHGNNTTSTSNTTYHIPQNGLYTIVRRGSTESKMKLNVDAETTFTSTSGTPPAGNIYIGCLNNAGTAALFNDGGYRAFFIGDQFTEAELLDIDQYIIEFIQTQAIGKTPFVELKGTVKNTSNPICVFGDSTIGNYPQGVNCLAVSKYLNHKNQYTLLDLAISGYTIANSKTAITAVDVSIKSTIKTVLVHIGLNDMNPATATATTIAAYQDLIDTIKSMVHATARVYAFTMIPFKEAFINRYGAVDGLLAYAKWQAVNESIMGGGASPITGLTGSIDSHTIAMDDGAGNIAAIYKDSVGPDYHENEAGRILIKNTWLTVI